MAQKHVKLTKDPAEGLVYTQKALGFVQQEETQANGRGDKRCVVSRSLSTQTPFSRPQYAANAYDLLPGRASALEQLSEHGCICRHQVSII
jgi:hypothetical protein